MVASAAACLFRRIMLRIGVCLDVKNTESCCTAVFRFDNQQDLACTQSRLIYKHQTLPIVVLSIPHKVAPAKNAQARGEEAHTPEPPAHTRPRPHPAQPSGGPEGPAHTRSQPTIAHSPHPAQPAPAPSPPPPQPTSSPHPRGPHPAEPSPHPPQPTPQPPGCPHPAPSPRLAQGPAHTPEGPAHTRPSPHQGDRETTQPAPGPARTRASPHPGQPHLLRFTSFKAPPRAPGFTSFKAPPRAPGFTSFKAPQGPQASPPLRPPRAPGFTSFKAPKGSRLHLL